MHAADQLCSISTQQWHARAVTDAGQMLPAQHHQIGTGLKQQQQHTITASINQSKHQSNCSLHCCRAQEANTRLMDSPAAAQVGPHAMATRHKQQRRPVGGYSCWGAQQHDRPAAAALCSGMASCWATQAAGALGSRTGCCACARRALAERIGNVGPARSHNGLPGCWQCGNISCNAAGWHSLEEGAALAHALLGGGFAIAGCRPPVQQPAVHLLIHLAMHVLDGLVAVGGVGWLGQQLPAWRQQPSRLVVDCCVVQADDEVLCAPQACLILPGLQLTDKLTEDVVELCCCDVCGIPWGVSW